jgi:hypothetical protein
MLLPANPLELTASLKSQQDPKKKSHRLRVIDEALNISAENAWVM